MKINLIVLKTSQPEKLAAFYQQLGMKFDHHKHGNGPFHFAAEVNDLTFEIYPLPKGSEIADDTLRLGFTVSNMEYVIQKLKTSGVKVIKDPTITEWGYQSVVEDPDGRKIEIKEEPVNSL
jgi:lactoylglutathione lyase